MKRKTSQGVSVFLKQKLAILIARGSRLVFITLINPVEPEAANHQSTRYGNGFHYAFYDSSVNSTHEQYFNLARTYWNQSPKVGIGRTYSRTAYTDKYSVASGDINTLVLGEVFPGYYDTAGVAKYNIGMDDKWDFVNLVLYTNTMQYAGGSSYSLSTASHVAAHEVGHTVKQKHPPSNISLNQSVVQTGYTFNNLPVIPGGSGNVQITTYDLNSVNSKF